MSAVPGLLAAPLQESDDAYELLPGILRELVDLPHFGWAATQKLVQRYGGVRLYVPKDIRPDHPLVELLGWEAAAALSAAFGGQDHFDIPMARAAIIAARNAQILADNGTLSQRTQALKYGLTERQIRNILSGVPEDDGQADLF